MKTLVENAGIPRSVLFTMAALAGLTVANMYYNQPLLEMMHNDLRISMVQANMITVITQMGYACGLFLVIPAGDLYNRRHITVTCMSLAALMLLAITFTTSIYVIWVASFLLGVCSVIPQIFMPIAAQFSKPENKSRNMGILLSGLLSGILGSRVISGFIGEWLGWQAMFGIAAIVMVGCMLTTLAILPGMKKNFTGNYPSLMKTVLHILMTSPVVRLYSIRSAFGFGSLLALWSCLAFHLAEAPFNAGSDKVGLLGLCGLASALACTGIGKFLPKYGYHKFSLTGSALQLTGWLVAFFMGDTYTGLILAIILVDVGVQFHQLSGQSGCISQMPSASSRVSAIFMTIFFIGGSLGTFLAGLGWHHAGWSGVSVVGFSMAVVALLITVISRK